MLYFSWTLFVNFRELTPMALMGAIQSMLYSLYICSSVRAVIQSLGLSVLCYTFCLCLWDILLSQVCGCMFQTFLFSHLCVSDTVKVDQAGPVLNFWPRDPTDLILDGIFPNSTSIINLPQLLFIVYFVDRMVVKYLFILGKKTETV
jgi:hypothetical protein